MNTRLRHLIQIFKQELGLFLSIAFGVFLFILFFQPFPLDNFDFNNRLLFVAGLAGIVFLTMGFVRVALPLMINKPEEAGDTSDWPTYLSGFLILTLSSVAFAFYLRYVGMVSISFYIMFKGILICFVPPVVLNLRDVIAGLKQQNQSLTHEIRQLTQKISAYREDDLTRTISFSSDNQSEDLELILMDVAFIRSADNYVEVFYRKGEDFHRKLVRNTLKNIALQLKPYSDFVRCHRTCIVNVHYIKSLEREKGSYVLQLKGNNEQLPVSRQYLLKIKEMI